MKKLLIPLALILFLGGAGAVTTVPVRKDRKPIVVEKMCYAEEIEAKDLQENEISFEIENEDDDCQSTTICVLGKAVVSVSPDSATIYAVIENMDGEMKISKDKNYQVFDSVVSLLKKKGLSEDQISLKYFSCSPYYDYASGKTLQGYMTSTSFSVKVDNLSKVKEYVDIMTENGVSGICNIEYEVSTIDQQYSSALSSAYQNAREKAISLLGEENLKLVKIKEERLFSSSTLARNFSEILATELVGKIEIQASVWAEFETECK